MRFKSHSGSLVYHHPGPPHPIEVRENRRYRWLNFGGISIQSAIDRKDPTTLVLPYMSPMISGIQCLLPTAKQVLLLGLGGGSLVHYFHCHQPDMTLTAIELNPMVIKIAQQFFALPAVDDRFKLINSDALTYLQNQNDLFDVIIADLYSNENLPKICRQVAFYQRITERLAQPGLFIANIIFDCQEELIDLLHMIQGVFAAQTICYEIVGYTNMLIFASNRPQLTRYLDGCLNAGTIDLAYDTELGLVAKAITPNT